MDISKITIMKMLCQQRPTIPEMAEEIGKANATVHKYLQELVRAGLVQPPRKPGAARDYHITEEGLEYLKVNGYIRV